MDLKVASVDGAFRNNRLGSAAPFCPVVSINLGSFQLNSYSGELFHEILLA